MQMQKCWLINWSPFLNIESRYILKKAQHMRDSWDCRLILPSSILSHPVALFLSTDLHFRAETWGRWALLSPSELAVMQGEGGTASITDCHRTICAQEHCCLLSAQVQHKNPWADLKPWLFLQGWTWGWAPSVQHLLKLLWPRTTAQLVDIVIGAAKSTKWETYLQNSSVSSFRFGW